MKWLTVLFTLFILLIIVLADMGQLGVLAYINRIPYADKAGHFILYGILALLINLTLFRALPASSSASAGGAEAPQAAQRLGSNRTRVAVISSLILALLIGLEEVSQRSFSTRTFSLGDLGASYLGLVFFSWLAWRKT